MVSDCNVALSVSLDFYGNWVVLYGSVFQFKLNLFSFAGYLGWLDMETALIRGGGRHYDWL